MIRQSVVSLLFGSFALLGAGPGVSAVAKPKPSVTLKIPVDRVDQNGVFRVDYTSHHLAPGTTLFLQHQVGTAHVWRSIGKLRGPSGSTPVLGRSMGIAEYRILATVKGKKEIATSKTAVYFYANIPFSGICGERSLCQNPGTVQIGSTDYTYEGLANALNWYPSWNRALNFPYSTTCRSAALTFAGQGNDLGPTFVFTSYVQLVEAGSEPQAANDTPTTVANLDVTFDGRPWVLNYSVTPDTGFYENVFFNGTFSCYTSTGK